MPAVLQPEKKGLMAAFLSWGLGHLGLVFSILRRLFPILRLGRIVVVTRHDDVREVLLNEADFGVTYAEKLKLLMGGQRFFMEIDDAEEAGRAKDALRLAVRREDIAGLAKRAEARSAELIARANGPLDVVSHVRQVTFDVFCDYLGLGASPPERLQADAMLLFEFLLADPFDDPALREEAERKATTLRDNLDELIRTARAAPDPQTVLGRCLALQAKGAGFTDAEIRTSLVGLIVGGLPQPAIAAAQGLNQLLLRPAELAGARQASRDDDEALHGYVFEALRFDPVAPMLTRRCKKELVLAAGTWRARPISEKATVIAALASAMMDQRRIADPRRFDPTRPWHDYLHFGEGLHACFAEAFCRALVPAMLKPLLRLDGLARAQGRRGRLTKRGFLADALWVTFPVARRTAAAPPMPGVQIAA